MFEHRTPFIQRRHYTACSRTGRSRRFSSQEMEMDGGHFCADRSQMSTIRPPVDNSTVGRIIGKPEDVGQSFYRPLGSDPATFSLRVECFSAHFHFELSNDMRICTIRQRCTMKFCLFRILK